MSSEQEIEVAYLVNALPVGLLDATPTRITDTYLSSVSDLLVKLRLRQNGDVFELTKKTNTNPEDLSVQDEHTIPLSKQEFDLFSSLGGRSVTKDRYKLAYQTHELEIDVFRGELEGLVIVECEFSSAAERDQFTPPPYCTTDVTQEDFIAGAFLAGKSYADISSELSRFGYTAIR